MIANHNFIITYQTGLYFVVLCTINLLDQYEDEKRQKNFQVDDGIHYTDFWLPIFIGCSIRNYDYLTNKNRDNNYFL